MKVTRRVALETIRNFCNSLTSEDWRYDEALESAVVPLIKIANATRLKSHACGHQNEDYPSLRCVRRFGHKGSHKMPNKGASWG